MFTLWAIALGVCVAGVCAWLTLGSFAIAYLSTHPPRRRPAQTPATFGAQVEDIAFPSYDGVPLSGWFIPSREAVPRGVVILCHGMSANREEVLPWAKPLWEQGFSLLLFDFRRLGQSGGKLCTAGYHETEDLRAAVDYVTSRPDVENLPLGVVGFSMGGAAAIMAAADDARIHAIATHGAYATLDRAITQRCRKHFHFFAPVAEWMTRRIGDKLGWFIAPSSLVAPIDAVSRLTPRPLLLLHGRRDRVIRLDDALDLHEAAGYPKSLQVLPRSGHKRIHHTIREEARESVADFFREHLAQETVTRRVAVKEPKRARKSKPLKT